MKTLLCGTFLVLSLSAFAQTGASGTWRGGLVTPPLEKPTFILNDTSGVPFDFRDRTKGRVTLLFFGYTNCPDQCPMHMANIGAALKTLPEDIAEQVKLVFVTTDPARDTPAQLRRWLDMFDKRFVGLTGSEAAINGVERVAGVPPAQKTEPRNGKYLVAHANFVLAYTRDNLAHVIYPGASAKTIGCTIFLFWLKRPGRVHSVSVHFGAAGDRRLDQHKFKSDLSVRIRKTEPSRAHNIEARVARERAGPFSAWQRSGASAPLARN